MEIIVCKDYKEVSQKAGSIIIKEMILNPKLILGLATGSSPVGIYENLIKANQEGIISFKDIKTYNLDEYIGIDRDHPESYYSFMFENLFKHVDINEENINIPCNNMDRINEISEEYNSRLDGNQRDLQILGIGSNGHIGFNEPGTPLSNETFITELNEETRKDNARFFGSVEKVPKFAITMGIKNIMYAKHILLIATGKKKAEAIHKMINNPINRDLPASILQLHPNCTVVIDEDAASMLEVNTKK